MKKLLALLLAIVTVITFTACDTSSPLSKESVSEGLNTEGTIEETIIYENNNIKITAKELVYNAFSVDLIVLLENNTDSELSFIANSWGYSVNSINEYMVSDGYLNCDVPAGESVEEVINFSLASFLQYGITSIAEMEIGFNIDGDALSDDIYTGPLQIKTAIADSYDYSVNRYQEFINSKSFEKQLDCKVKHFDNQTLYNAYNITLSSVAIIVNNEGETSLLVEINNKNSSEIHYSIGNIYFNGALVCDSSWTGESINGNKSYVDDISIESLAEDYEGNISDIANISEISFTLEVGEIWYDPVDTEEITISIPNIELSLEESN